MKRTPLAYLLSAKNLKIKLLLLTLTIATLTLYALGYLEIIISFLESDRLTLNIGQFKFSSYRIIKLLIFYIFVSQILRAILVEGEKRIKQIKILDAANRTLLVKIFQTGTNIFILMICLNIIGIDITTFAVLGGAIGIGIGFGLQKIAANFISGLILLAERSVKEGDLIELPDGVSGFVKNTGARYTLIETFDARELMIPNEDFVTKRVTNWTHTNKNARTEIKIGVSYDSDIHKAYELLLEAVNEHEMCSKSIKPQCYLEDYGDSSVEFTLHFWIDDINDGRKRLRSDILFSIWSKFKEHNIEIPFPQQELHIKTKNILDLMKKDQDIDLDRFKK